MTAFAEREQRLEYFDEVVSQGARAKAAAIMGLDRRTVQRWQRPETLQADGRPQRTLIPSNKLSDEERAKMLALANSEEFKDRTPHQIVPC